MQIINYSLQRRENLGLSVLLDGTVQLGEYQKPDNLHAIALDNVELGASMTDIIRRATVLTFSLDTICRGALIHAVIGTITLSDLQLIADRSEDGIFRNLLIQFPKLGSN